MHMQVYYSPQFESGNKSSHSGTYTSPGTPEYNNNNNNNSDNNVFGFQKGWCSERVPLSNNSRRHISAAALMPFNSGRTLPSKWDDAERWITSPVSGVGVSKTVVTPPERRTKAKSGPLDGESVMSFHGGSPLTTGVLVADGMGQSANVPGWSELLIESSYPHSQDEQNDENGILRVASRRDMATQMSSESSPETSPSIPHVEPSSHHSARVEVRDVQVDKGADQTSQLKRQGTRNKTTRLPEVNTLALTLNTTEGAMKLSKLQKEEARITAWENLQNAKAEASIRKLEMKLEKKKSASLNKILNKNRAAQMKAEDMRRNMSEDVSPRNSHKFRSFCRSFTNRLKCCFHRHH